MSDSVADGYPQKVDKDKKLNLKTKLAYGAGDLGPAITANISVFFLLVFFTNVAGIPAGLAGSILMVGKIWDAVNDPFVGVLTDRTESKRWGSPSALVAVWCDTFWYFLLFTVDCTKYQCLGAVLVLCDHRNYISGIFYGG